MADESIIGYMRPSFPVEGQTDKSFTTTIEYVGPASVLKVARPEKNDPWGNYPGIVSSTSWQPFETLETDPTGILTVVVEDAEWGTDATYDTGTKTNIDYEIDWVDQQTPLIQHPEFAPGAGGTYQLTERDVANIELWKVEKNPAYKEEYKYTIESESGESTSFELSANAKMFAKGIVLGIEYFSRKTPVARRTETWVNGPPDECKAGLKETPTGFPNLPTGYEWIREADRSLKQGTSRKWNRDIEWIGEKVVLIDAADVFWTAP
jgi:hypothetical protein